MYPFLFLSESLFCLGEDELGRLEDTDKPGAKVGSFLSPAHY